MIQMCDSYLFLGFQTFFFAFRLTCVGWNNNTFFTRCRLKASAAYHYHCCYRWILIYHSRSQSRPPVDIFHEEQIQIGCCSKSSCHPMASSSNLIFYVKVEKPFGWDPSSDPKMWTGFSGMWGSTDRNTASWVITSDVLFNKKKLKISMQLHIYRWFGWGDC